MWNYPHKCPEWDYMLIHPGDVEMDACICKDQAGPKYQCTNCGDIIQSMHRHDFVTCKCWQESDQLTGFTIDGGSDYVGINGISGVLYIEDNV